jgi:hypothetical protein
MRAQAYFESESSAGLSVGVGCPSFGGQRTVRGHSDRLRASLVTDSKPSLNTERTRAGMPLSSQLEASSRVAVLGEGFCIVAVIAPGRQMGENPFPGWPSLQYQMLEVSTGERHASVAEGQALLPVAASRSGHLLAQPGWPNPSVKGTSRKRAAPYVER